MLCPDAIENAAGVTVIDDNAGAFTTTPALPAIEFSDAVIVTVPALSAVSMPVLLTAAIVGSELRQAT